MIKQASLEEIKKIRKSLGLPDNFASKEPSTPINDVEATDEEIENALRPKDEYFIPLEFEDAVDLLFTVDQSLFTKRRKLHKWQVETLLFLSKDTSTISCPLRYFMYAANGSGKDAYINSPIAVFFSLCKIRHKTVVTSASYQQLNTQTEPYIRSLCFRLNKKFQELEICDRLFIVKKQHIVCSLTGSEIIMFVTDDPGRAEGHHPFPDYPDAEETIIINEAKSVPEDIFEALGRCTFNRWIEISSPGKTSGHFYNSCRSAITYPNNYISGQRYARQVTSYDCEHISKEKIDADKDEWGENSAIFRSKHLAEFTTIDEQVVITEDHIKNCLNANIPYIDLGLPRRAGLDLSGGGDENTLYIFDNNKYIGRETFRATDTDGVTVRSLIEFFQKWGLKQENIYGDDQVIGQPIIDNLAGRGWNINRVRNQWRPILKNGPFANRGAELWFSFARFVQEQLVILPKDDPKLMTQLATRYYKQHDTNGRIVLESKQDARLHGRPSPDRADAVVLAFCGLTSAEFKAKRAELPQKPPSMADIENYALKESRDKQLEYLMKEARNSEKEGQGKIVFHSPSSILHHIYGN